MKDEGGYTPSLQERLSTEQEVRRLIELADADSSRSAGHNEPSGHKKSNSMKDIIEIPDSDEEMGGDVTEIKIGVINGNNDIVELNNDVIRVDGNPDSAVSRISKKLGVSEDRAKAALKMTGNDEKSAFDMVSRQLRKVTLMQFLFHIHYKHIFYHSLHSWLTFQINFNMGCRC